MVIDWVATPGLAGALPSFYKLVGKQLRTPAQGADTIVWLATAPDETIGTGKFWFDRLPRTTHVFGKTRETAEERLQLMNKLDEMAGGAV